MKKVILHIGQPKTGSSALQNYFYHNKEKLEANKIGYYYPKYSWTPWPTYGNGSLVLAEALLRFKENLKENNKLLKEDLILFKEYAKEYETLIFSE